jgi:hypothetical protein
MRKTLPARQLGAPTGGSFWPWRGGSTPAFDLPVHLNVLGSLAAGLAPTSGDAAPTSAALNLDASGGRLLGEGRGRFAGDGDAAGLARAAAADEDEAGAGVFGDGVDRSNRFEESPPSEDTRFRGE